MTRFLYVIQFLVLVLSSSKRTSVYSLWIFRSSKNCLAKTRSITFFFYISCEFKKVILSPLIRDYNKQPWMSNPITYRIWVIRTRRKENRLGRTGWKVGRAVSVYVSASGFPKSEIALKKGYFIFIYIWLLYYFSRLNVFNK